MMMSESLNTRSMIFTLYGEYVRHYGNDIWIGSLIRLLKEFGHNDQSVRAAISRMSKQGWVEARKEGNKSYYYLTERGIRRMDEAAERIFKLRPAEWDGRWRMFLYTIPEEKRHIRDELRKELVWSGFGSSSASLWLSPNHLEEQVKWLIDKYEINDYVHFFVADYKGPHENHALVNECWDLNEISNRYREFIKMYSERYVIDRSKIEKGKMSDGDCFVERAKLVHEYRKFLFIDPGLPSQLLPDEWPGEHAAMLFSDYYKTLAKPASRFFEEVFREGNELKNKDNEYDALQHPLLSDRP